MGSINYRPLAYEEKEIRLLELQPQQSLAHAVLPTCRLFHTSLLQSPEYRALSYTWGDQQQQRVIVLDGQPVYVGRSLHEAMCQLRPLDKPLVIWIDALCINQNDMVEKSWQVNLMQRIYAETKEVLVWLGPAENDSDSTIRYLDRLGRKGIECGIRGIITLPPSVKGDLQALCLRPSSAADSWVPFRLSAYLVFLGVQIKSWQQLHSLFSSINGSGGSSTMLPFQGIQDLFGRAWWGRIWVFQEVALPGTSSFVCGKQRIRDDRLKAAVGICHLYHEAAKMAMSAKQHHPTTLRASLVLYNHRATLMLNAREIYLKHRFPLVALLRLTCVGSINLDRHGPHNLESTDPRDKIYALLSLASDRSDLIERGVRPDYQISCAQAYQSVTAAMLEQGHIAVLSMCQKNGRNPEYASWTPDWSRSVTSMLQDVHPDHVTLYPEFAASGKTFERPLVLIQRAEGIVVNVSIRGLIYDSITDVASFANRRKSTEVPLNETFTWPVTWLQQMIALTYSASRSKCYQTFEDRLRAAARTSIGGVGYNDNMELIKIREDRFGDAVALLRRGLDSLVQPIYDDAKSFLARDGSQYEVQDKPFRILGLSNEIIGKCLGRLPFLTAKGHLVLTSEHVQPGDLVVLVKGAQVPYVLRKRTDEKLEVISEAYVDGIMNGEAADDEPFDFIQLA